MVHACSISFADPAFDESRYALQVAQRYRTRHFVDRVESDDIAFIRITTFNEQTTEGLKREIAALTTQIGADKLKGFIIDLRNNPGGLLEEAVTVSDTFLERGIRGYSPASASADP